MGAPELSGDRFVLLGGGEIRDYEVVRRQIRPHDRVICADSGYDHCRRLHLRPDYLVGDFDSVRGDLPQDIPTLRLNPEKDYTDITHAVDKAMELGCRWMLLAGVLGGRLDHTFANLATLGFLSRRGIEAVATDGETDAYAVTGTSIRLPYRERVYFSVFSLTETSRGVDIRGAKYPLEDYTLYVDLARGVSNEFLTGPVEISVREGTLLILVVPKDMA